MAESSSPCLSDLKAIGVIPMRAAGFFSVRLSVVGGRVEAEQLACLSRLATKYGRGSVHLTTRQGIEIPYVAQEQVEALRAELAECGLEFGVCGPRVRTVVACPGRDCSHGLIDSQALARRMHERAKSYPKLPHKFKIAVTGCPNACAKPIENDFGVMGVARKAFEEPLCAGCGLCAEACKTPGALSMVDGRPVCSQEICRGCERCLRACATGAWKSLGPAYRIFLGGKMGGIPRMGRSLEQDVESEQAVLEVLDAVIAWYCANGVAGERLGAALERCGMDSLNQVLAGA